MRISRLGVLFVDWIAVRIYRLLRVHRFAIFMVGEQRNACEPRPSEASADLQRAIKRTANGHRNTSNI